MGAKTLAYFLGTTALATGLGLLAVRLVEPGLHVSAATRDRLLADYADKAAAKIDAAHSTDFGVDTIVGIVTRNPIASAVDGDRGVAVSGSVWPRRALEALAHQLARRVTGGSAADMFVGLDLRGGPAVMLDLGGAAEMFVGLDPRGSPAVARDLGSAADSSAPRPAVACALGSAADMFVGPAPPRWPRGDARPRQRGGHVRRLYGLAVARDLGSAADMFVGLDPRSDARPRQRGGHVHRLHGPRWRAASSIPAVTLDLGSAADMFVGLDPRGSPAVTLDLGSAADMFAGRSPR